MRLLSIGLTAAILLISNISTNALSYPSARITNGVLSADLYLPDLVNGSYRATRFDWSGIIRSLTYEGHSYFGQWYDVHDPLIHDAKTQSVRRAMDRVPPGGLIGSCEHQRFCRFHGLDQRQCFRACRRVAGYRSFSRSRIWRADSGGGNFSWRCLAL